MTYKVENYIFEKVPNIVFGIIVAKNIKNSQTTNFDEHLLSKAEEKLQERLKNVDLKETFKLYRTALQNVGINPNKFPNSVEAMSKRIIKGGKLPNINALVDLCNVVALNNLLCLGAHDLDDIKENLEVRRAKIGDKFLPFGLSNFEEVPKDEIVFTSGNKVQTRNCFHRQSELGKTRIESQNLIFQLVGFKEDYENFLKALKEVEELVVERFDGSCETFIVDAENPKIEFF